MISIGFIRVINIHSQVTVHEPNILSCVRIGGSTNPIARRTISLNNYHKSNFYFSRCRTYQQLTSNLDNVSYTIVYYDTA